ncbi:MAG: hypothetical protein M3N07_03420 [Pseudomonadota bacterium]|nr:hypothetical protein [Pseudomonadota bacterium]
MRDRATMPRWPAWVMFAAAAACAYPAVTSPPPADPAQEHYEARGQEPGWHLVIHGGRINYTGNYGEKRISVARPDPRPTFNGRRYETPRLTVDISYSRCNDAMSGHGYEHQVMVIADGHTFRGCGGERRPEWDV